LTSSSSPIGEGLIDHGKTVRALKNIEYDRSITLEVFTNSNDAKSSTDKLKIMWAKNLVNETN
jgi:sugar phosphate isomerase/epimerase